MTTNVKIGLIQLACSKDLEQNFAHAVQKMKEAASKGAQIICLPELFLSHYFCHEEDYDSFQLAEPIPGPTTERLSPIAKELGTVIIASLFEKRTSGVYHNATAVIDADGTYLGKYRKLHIPDDPGYFEKFYFTPGDLGFKTFSTTFGKIGILICWDQWYPEGARITALMGADMLFFPTAIGWALNQDEQTNQDQYQAWQVIQRSHAIANGLPVVAVNRVGIEEEMRFWGGSFIANSFGRVLYQASHETEEVAVQEINLDQSDYYRTHWPFLRDRRIDCYQLITKRFIDEPAT